MHHTHFKSFYFIFLIFATVLASCSDQAQAYRESETSEKDTQVSEKKIPEVQVLKILNESINTEIQLTGRLKALREITIVAEVQGEILQQNKELDVGRRFKTGETLLKIERNQMDLSLYAMRAKFKTQVINLLSDLEADHPEVFPKWKNYTDAFDYKTRITALPAFSDDREEYLFNLRNIPGQYLDIKAQEDLLSKYQIKAPFSGVITQTSVDYGDIVTPGKPLATLQGTAVYEYEAAVSEEDLNFIKIGDHVQLKNTNTHETYTGKVLRTGGIINDNTQTVPIYISLSGKHLKQGMYLEGTIRGKTFKQVAAIPSTSITRNNEVYIIKNNTIDLLPIHQVGTINGKTIIKGVPDHTLIVNQTISTSTLRGKIKPVQIENTQKLSLR